MYQQDIHPAAFPLALSAADSARVHNDGYVVVKNVLTPQAIVRLRDRYPDMVHVVCDLV